MAESNMRESQRRRRRILQQGSDRLAFIKGQIQTLPSPNLPHAVEEEESSNPVLQNHVSDSSRNITQTPPTLNENQNNENEISTFPTSEIEPEQQVQQPQPPTISDSNNEIFQQQPRTDEEPRSNFNFIIPSDVSNAIDASRVTRFCCSIIVALLVVASYLGFTLINTVMISFKPLYLVLLTNSTFVVAKLISKKHSRGGFDERSWRTNSTEQWDSQLAKTLEIGMVVKSVVDAVFMDCAVYAIVLICSLSLVHS